MARFDIGRQRSVLGPPSMLSAVILVVLLSTLGLFACGRSSQRPPIDRPRLPNLTVESDGMAPTLVPGDIVVVDPSESAWDSLIPGDVVAWDYAPGDMTTDTGPIVMFGRVYGVAGQAIEIGGEHLRVDGAEVDPGYNIPKGFEDSYKVPKGYVFILADSENGIGSLTGGPLSRESFLGKAIPTPELSQPPDPAEEPVA